jgi:hypothetical protein
MWEGEGIGLMEDKRRPCVRSTQHVPRCGPSTGFPAAAPEAGRNTIPLAGFRPSGLAADPGTNPEAAEGRSR